MTPVVRYWYRRMRRRVRRACDQGGRWRVMDMQFLRFLKGTWPNDPQRVHREMARWREARREAAFWYDQGPGWR